MCRGKPEPDFNLLQCSIEPLCKVLIENHKDETLIDVCWAISYMTDANQELIDKLVQVPGLL